MADGLKTDSEVLQAHHHALRCIDWSAPWLQSWRTLGEGAAETVMAGMSQPEAFNNLAIKARSRSKKDPPMQFVSQAELPPGVAYERYIFQNGSCPTREGLHDFFNGLAWFHFPLTKRRLNHLHVRHIALTGITPGRGPARDALTLFDENAALLRAPDALWGALMAKDWPSVFGDLRGLWAESFLVLFGHALLEKLVFPRKPITAHVYRVHPATDSIADLDAWVATSLTDEVLATKPFAHLPVLGVPGWWIANETKDFYNDATVFRKPRLP